MMSKKRINRRAVLAASSLIGAASLLPRRAFAQAGTPAGSLPARGEFVVRGAHVLSMDSAIGDLVGGDVHVRNGSIVAVGMNLAAPGAEAIEGRGMICMPGLVETHWHHWTNVCRPFVRNDDPKLGYFRSRRNTARTTSRKIPTAAPGSASPRRWPPASPRHTTGVTTREARPTPTPKSAPCMMSASAAVMPMAIRLARRTTFRWTWPILRVSTRRAAE